MKGEKKFTIELQWNDDSSTFFDVIVNGKPHEYNAKLMWVTRGSLMASNAKRAICYNEEGFDVLSYIK